MSRTPTTRTDSKPVRVAVLCLDGYISLYSETLSFIAWKLQREGASVVRLGCEGQLNTCTSYNSTGKLELSELEKKTICKQCKRGQRDIRTPMSFELNDADTSEHHKKAISFVNAVRHGLASSGRVSSVLDMHYEGLPLCRIAFFDFAIVAKLSGHSRLEPAAAERFVAGVHDLTKLLSSFQRFNETYDITHLVYLNGNYTHNTLARNFFSAKGVICLSVEPQLTSQHVLNRVLLAPDRLSLHPDGLLSGMAVAVPVGRHLLDSIRSALSNFGARIKGADYNAYTSLDETSVATDEASCFREFLDAHDKITSFFLSSEDELTPHMVTHGVTAVENPNPLGPFLTQFEFCSYFLRVARQHPDRGFIIRLHPRMAANKRDHFESEEHRRYKKLFATESIPHNVFILYGESKVSSYFIINKSDLVVISWSTIGLEALLLGTPVVSAFPSYLIYPLSALSCQPTHEEQMTQALTQASSFGAGDDKKLLVWLGQAFEGQFFETAAPRGQGGSVGKLYRKLHRSLKKVGLLSLLYRLVDKLLLGDLKLDNAVLLTRDNRSSPSLRSPGEDPLILVKRYREDCERMLADYGMKILRSS